MIFDFSNISFDLLIGGIVLSVILFLINLIFIIVVNKSVKKNRSIHRKNLKHYHDYYRK